VKLLPKRFVAGICSALLAAPLWAQICSDIFSDGITSNSNGGGVTFQSGSRVINSPDAILETKNLSDFAGSNVSCDGVSCTKSGSAGIANNYNNFSNNNNSVSVGSGGSLNLAPDDYRNIVVNSSATLFVSAGDYHLWGDLSVSASANIVVSGGGTVRIFVRGDADFDTGSQINSSGASEQLLIYTRGDLTFAANTVGQGLFYARGDFDIGSNAQLAGAISGKQVELFDGSAVTYDASVFDGDFSGFCTSPPAGVDHYALSHAVNFVTCEAAPVLVSAHDATHLAVTAATTISLSTSSNLGDWSADGAASGTLNNGSSNDGVASYSFGAGEQTVQLYLSHSSVASNVDIDISDGAATDLDGDATEDAMLNFADAALRFYADGVADNIATQLSRKNSDVAPNAQTLSLRAVETNTDTGACQAAIQGNQIVAMAYECQNPASCVGGETLTLAGSNPAANPNGSVTAFTDITLNFNASGIASLGVLNYSDAGLIRLHAQTDLPASAPNPAITLEGQSNAFVSKPAGLCVRATAPAASCAAPYLAPFTNCSAFVAAASDFEIEISGRGWGGALESNDAHCDNGVTPNFKATLALTAQLVAPAAGVNGALAASSASITGAGAVLLNQQYNEVGVMAMSAALTAPYINGEIIANSSSASIGRFIPAQFLVSEASINEACTGFSYMAQPFTALFTLQAVNSSGDITRNYAGDFVRPLITGYPSFGAVNDSPLTELTARMDNSAGTTFDWPPVGNVLAGEGLATATLQFVRESLNAVDGPYSVNLGVQVIDEDGVDIIDDLDLDTDTNSIDDYATIGQTMQRYGRLRLENAFGSELLPLPVPVSAEFFDGSRFIASSDDNCSVIDPAGVTLSDFSTASDEPIVASDTSIAVPVSPVAVINGAAMLEFSAPGTENYGSLNLALGIDAWLQFDWGGGTIGNPQSRMTFGRYRGEDRVIYRHEVLQ
jgi:hypothetical protein